MQVIPSAYFSAFRSTSKSALTLSALSLACCVQAQVPGTRPLPQAPKRAQAKAHAHSDSSSLTVIGLLAGGAALMAAGGHSGGGSPSDTSAAQSPAIQPQFVVTGNIPHAASMVSFTETTPVSGAASPVLVTQPIAPTFVTAETMPPLSSVQTIPTVQTDPAVIVQDMAAADFSPRLLPGQGLNLPDGSLGAPAPSVPEPSASLALAVGSLGLAALVLRGRRRCQS